MSFRFSLSILIASFLMVTARAGAQQPNNSLTITPHRQDLLSITSRDYWVAFPENYNGTDQGGKYIMLYISSVDSTTAYVALAGDTTALSVTPGKPVTLNVPLGLEMHTSDSIENKAVHVWSNDAALFVDFNSHDAYTSDASYVIPSIGWGHTYTVAAYESLYEEIVDLPSEFVIISDQDSTSVTITPSTALRSTRDNGMVYPAGIPFTIAMSEGQAVQYQTIPNVGDVCDVTGTKIVASNPVGVVGAVSCANIPSDFPYCDFICEMIPPMRTWGTTYYTAPLYGRAGGDMYLVIGTKRNQQIFRTDTGSETIDTLVNANDHAWLEAVSSSKWASGAPFLLVQYSNSSTYPNSVNGLYDPFMMAVNSVDQFSTPVIFNVLHGATDQKPYFWHADIVARSGVPVYIDGSKLTSAPIYDDKAYAVYRMDSLKPRQYIASSDSGVSVSVYGDGYDEAVGYSGMIGVSTLGGTDVAAPQVSAIPLSAAVTRFSASDESSNMSGLSEFEIDSLSNMRLIQAPGFVNGGGSATGSFDLVVTDSTQPGSATVRVLDLAGNYTRIEKNYTPQVASVSSPSDAGQTLNPSPNPANGWVTFSYSLPKDGHVSIALYDVLGDLQLSVLNANEGGGLHTATADVRLLPAGTYIYRIDGGGKVQSGRISIER